MPNGANASGRRRLRKTLAAAVCANGALVARIQVARELTGGQDAVDRFLKWTLPSGGKAEDEGALADAAHDDVDDEDN